MNNRNIQLYVLARFISLIGTGIQTIAVPLFILDLTGSGTAMGIFSVLTILPAIFTAVLSGIIGDRKNRKYVMIAMDLARGMLIFILALLATINYFNIYILFIMQIFLSIMDETFSGSSIGLMPELIDNTVLLQANSLKEGFDAVATIIGPALGGVLYGLFGIKIIFYINSVSFMLSAILSYFIIYKSNLVKKEKLSTKIFLREISEVLKFLFRKKGLFQLSLFAMLSNFLLVPLFDLIMPYALKKGIHFSSQQYGYITCFFTVGLLLGNVAISLYLKKFRLKLLMKIGLIFESFTTIIMCLLFLPIITLFFKGSIISLFIVMCIFYMLIGFFNATLNTPISTNLQELVPNDMRSRFFSIFGLLTQVAIPLGSFILGFTLDKIKYYDLLIALSLIIAIIALIFLLKACDEAYEAEIITK
ncbi:MFS transporter [Clostridium felsineum]|uniref:Enterobactin exporter EntS n=1 Tax=Clostridium felsineum TaxID=36839 RepID=A0A1S8LZQ8_9CLOT|nr:MFS transporter [Clostridium felsineum]URZ09162.1 Enterobactin exporter EntS [Clostridium felsineum]URZ13848.1 Enterobactin exporter EntS [Clostridium felsineum]